MGEGPGLWSPFKSVEAMNKLRKLPLFHAAMDIVAGLAFGSVRNVCSYDFRLGLEAVADFVHGSSILQGWWRNKPIGSMVPRGSL